jgi:putative transposase
VLDTFAASAWGKRYPAAGTTWENAWNASSPFLAFPPALHKIIYTTNAIESLNYTRTEALPLRRRGDQAALACDSPTSRTNVGAHT